jgi:hypothetical protein
MVHPIDPKLRVTVFGKAPEDTEISGQASGVGVPGVNLPLPASSAVSKALTITSFTSSAKSSLAACLLARSTVVSISEAVDSVIFLQEINAALMSSVAAIRNAIFFIEQKFNNLKKYFFVFSKIV